MDRHCTLVECWKWEEWKSCLCDKLAVTEEVAKTARHVHPSSVHRSPTAPEEQLQTLTRKLESTETLVTRLSREKDELLRENEDLMSENLYWTELAMWSARQRCLEGRVHSGGYQSEQG